MSILVFSRNFNFTLIFSLQNQSFQIGPKLFLELDNDVLIMFPKWFRSIILSVRTVSILVFSRNLNFTLNYIALVLIFSLQNQSFQIGPKLFLELDNDVLIMFPRGGSSIILSVRTMSILVGYGRGNDY